MSSPITAHRHPDCQHNQVIVAPQQTECPNLPLWLGQTHPLSGQTMHIKKTIHCNFAIYYYNKCIWIQLYPKLNSYCIYFWYFITLELNFGSTNGMNLRRNYLIISPMTHETCSLCLQSCLVTLEVQKTHTWALKCALKQQDDLNEQARSCLNSKTPRRNILSSAFRWQHVSKKYSSIYITLHFRWGMKEWLRGFQIWNDMMGRDWWCKSHMNLLPQAKVNSWESLQWWAYETLCHSARQLLLNPVLEGTRLSFCWVTDCNTGKHH